MQQFTGLQYLKIDLANQYGLDKVNWEDRLEWFESNKDNLESLVPDGKTKPLYLKALHAYRNMDKPTGFIMALDACNSGVQVMAALGKCLQSARTCGLINTGRREDLYGYILSKIKGVTLTRDQIKEAIVPMLYGSAAAPKELFGEGSEELKEFLQAVEQTIPILGDMKTLAGAVWKSDAKEHSWVMPDGHKVVLPTLVTKKMRVEVCGTSFTYQYEDIGTDENSTPLLSHIVHSTDAYITREMVRRCKFDMVHIHDNYYAHVNNMQAVRETYKEILIEIAKSNLLEDILSQIKGKPVKLKFTDPDLWIQMQDAEYMLS